MGESEFDEKDNLSFFKDAINRPNTNIRGSSYLSVGDNIGLLLLMFILTVMTLFVAYLPVAWIFSGFEQYEAWGIMIVFIGMMGYVLLIPVMMVHITILYFLNKKFRTASRSFKKVFSDHTAILIPTFLLFSIGLYFFSLDVWRPYIMLAGILIIFISVVVYVRRSILLVKHYAEDAGKNAFYVYAAVLIAIAVFGFPFYVNYIYEGFFEQLLVGISMMFEDIGLR